jgi:hypothetical protein
MNRGRLERLAPLAGVVYFALIVAAFVVFPDTTPDADESRAKVVKFWLDHDSEAMLSAFFFGLSAVPLLWFAGSLRSICRKAEGETGRLSAVAFGGAIILAGGIALGANLQFIIADIADNVPPDTVQAVAAVSDEFFFPYVLGGALWLFATGVVSLRYRVLHPVLGWVAILIGVVSVTPAGFFGFLAAIVWVLVVSISLYLRGDSAPSAPSAS